MRPKAVMRSEKRQVTDSPEGNTASLYAGGCLASGTMGPPRPSLHIMFVAVT